MEIDLVCSGGGAKGIALLGAVDFLQEEGFTFARVAGTSVGAILGALIQAGYSMKELLYSIKSGALSFSFMPRKSVLHSLLGFKRWVELYWKLGLYSLNDLEQMLKNRLAEKGIRNFLDLPPNALQIVASDLTRKSIVVFPRDSEMYKPGQSLSVATAACISAAVPFFFQPRYLVHRETKQKCMLVDGGILSNFPMWLFDKGEGRLKRPVLGLQLQSDFDSAAVPNADGALMLMRQMLQTMQTAHDRAYIQKRYAKNIVFIPVGKTSATDFLLSDEEIDVLFQSGRESCMRFLKTWSH